MTAVASAPGRVCLAGEDLDWMGGHSVQLAVELRTVVESELRPARSPSAIVHDRVSVREATAHEAIYPLAALGRVEAESGPLEGQIRVSSSLPQASGLASSAAVLVATLASAAAELQLGWSRQQVAEVAYEVELGLTGGCVGPMDPIACAEGGLTCLGFSGGQVHAVGRRAQAPDVSLVLAGSGSRHATGASIGRKKERWARSEASIVHYQASVDKAALSMIALLEGDQDVATLGTLVTSCHRALATDMGVSAPDLDGLVERALASGAVGAKLCGSGEGGFIVALTAPGDGPDVVQGLRAMGAQVLETTIADGGLLVS